MNLQFIIMTAFSFVADNWELVVAAIAALSTAGLFNAIKKAVKENKEAYEQGEIILKRIKEYKAGGFSSREINQLIREFEKFAQEAKEAVEANAKVWNIIKKAIPKGCFKKKKQ